MKQEKNLQPKQVEAHEYKHRKQIAGKTSACRTRRLWEPPHQRMTFRSPDRHLAKPKKQAITHMREGRKEDPRRVLITRQTGESYTVPPGDH